MSSAESTLNEVSLLLAAVPGVSVLERRIDGRSANIRVATVGIVSAHVVQRLCETAKVEIEPPVRLDGPRWSVDVPRPLSLSANAGGSDPIEFGALQGLGIALVRHLQRTGAMPAAAAERFLQRWGASHPAPSQ
ncbi:MAG: hypothetical protein ABWY31_03545 [Pseudoxanthomonas sp.]